MIFDPTTCCACAAVQELQGEAPLTLSGEGLWAGVLSSGQCVLDFKRAEKDYPTASPGAMQLCHELGHFQSEAEQTWRGFV